MIKFFMFIFFDLYSYKTFPMKQYFLTIMALFSFTLAQERVMLEGEYTYKWGDNETVLVAKSLCYNMALRNMVESYQIFVASTTDIQNYEVRNDLIQTLSAGYLEDLTVVEERIEKEKNVAYYKLRAYVRPVEFKRALQQQVVRKLEIYKPKPVRENEYFAVLKQWELRNNDLCFIIQFKQMVDMPMNLKLHIMIQMVFRLMEKQLDYFLVITSRAKLEKFAKT